MFKNDSGPSLYNEEIKESSRFIVLIWIICRSMGLIPLKIRKCTENGKTVWFASFSRGWTVYSWAFLVFTGISLKMFYYNLYWNC